MSNKDIDQDDIWVHAVSQYEIETGNTVGDEAVVRQLKTADDLLNFVESKGSVFTNFRARHQKVCSRIKRCLDPVALLSEVGSNAAGSTAFGLPAAIVLSSVAHLITASQQVSNAYDWIQTVFAELEDFTQRLSSYASTSMTDALKRKVTATLAFLLRVVGRSEVLIKRKRFSMYLRVSFLGKDEKTKGLLEELNRHMSSEQRMVVAITYEQTKQSNALASTAVAQGSRIEEKISALRKDMRHRQLDDNTLRQVEKTLCTAAVDDTDDRYSMSQKTLLSGSGAWLEKEPLFDSWLQQSALILWIFGGPGSGKTMLSTWLINFLLGTYVEHSDFNKGTSVGYFYIREDNERLRNPNAMLKTIAWQLQQIDLAFKQHASFVCRTGRNTARAEDTWENLFINFYQSSAAEGHRAILIIDGLDEAESEVRRRLLTLFKDYVRGTQTSQPHRIQIAIFGRTTLRSDLHTLNFEREEKIIHVSPGKNQEDLSNYILDRVQKLAVVQEMRNKREGGRERAKRFIRHTRKQVLDGADGVFLWAQLILDQMKGKDEGQIRKLLATPPRNLEDMIYSVLKRLSQDPELDQETTARILMWISFSRRPLKFGELDVIARLDSGTTNWMLWTNMTGQFASTFRLRYPKIYNPNVVFEHMGDTEGSDAVKDQADDITLDTTNSSTDSESEGDLDSRNSNDVAELQESESGNTQKFEADEKYNWYQKNTIVEFTHTRFRDMIKIEGDPKKRQRESLPILLNTCRAEILIAIDCLKMIYAAPLKDEYNSYYLSYPIFKLFSHVQSIEEVYLDPSERVVILEGLYLLLHEEEGCRLLFLGLGERRDGECDDFLKIWFHGNGTIKLIQQWFRQTNIPPIQDPAKILWMKAASTSARVLLEPLAKTAAKIWLTKSGYDDLAYLDKSGFQIWFLKMYMTLDVDGHVSDELANFVWSRNGFSINGQEVEPLAEWAGLERTTHWYSGVGWTLYESGEVDRALTLLAKAIEMDPTAWVAMEATARCQAEYKGDYQTAIEWIKKAIDCMPVRLKDISIDAYLLGHCSIWLQALGDREQALETAKRAFDENHYSPVAVDSYINLLADTEQWTSLMEVLRQLDDDTITYEYSVLVDTLKYYGLKDAYGPAYRKCENSEFLLRAMDDTLEILYKQSHEDAIISCMCSMARFRYEWCDQTDEPMKLLEEALERLEATDAATQRRIGGSITEDISKLAQIYFDSAVASHRSGQDSNRAARKLERLATVIGTDSTASEDAFKYYTDGYAALLWGRWLRDYAEADDTVWKKCFRSRILEQMNGLDDEDPTNDTNACTSLAVSLFQAGDSQNAAAILAVLFKTLEASIQDQTHQRSEDFDDELIEKISSNQESHLERLNNIRLDGSQAQETVDRRDSNSASVTVNHHVDISEEPADRHFAPTPQPTDHQSPADPPPQTSPVLELHIDSNSWSYWCDSCERDAKEAGTMYDYPYPLHSISHFLSHTPPLESVVSLLPQSPAFPLV